jgi:addiction module RelE/StbE family toxin
MAGKPIRKATFVFKPAFEQSLQTFARRDPQVTKNLAAFITAKTERPPVPLSRGMRDHSLTGQLSAFKECHLAGDACLIYTDKADVVTLLIIVDHDDMYGPKSKALAKRIAAP